MTEKVLIAGVGNRLMGDDGFGPRVIDILSNTPLPPYVEARDIGTAGITIATDLRDYSLIVFLDSMNFDGEPGQLMRSHIKVEDVGDIGDLARLTLHEVGLEGLLRFSKGIGALPPNVVLIGCKPKTIEPSLNLSPEVEGSLQKAAEMAVDAVEDYIKNKVDRVG